MAEEERISVTVLYSATAREVHEWELALAAGATVLEAIRASGAGRLLADADLSKVAVGIWGRQAGLDHVLRQHDRVEIYRPLRIDPKVARRERFREQGTRAAGLFARTKSGRGTGR
jgi:putative ubiquitin-RnfH superfamily antitoxin RatB of RatAB toxin-antitoxin module